MNTIPKAEDFLYEKFKHLNATKEGLGEFSECIIEFTKLHVKEALEEASKVKISYKSKFLIKQEILNCYPENLIK